MTQRICYEYYKPTDPQYRTHVFRYYCARGFIEKGWKVLDLGCGCGFGCELFSEVAGSVLGVDIDPQPLDHAREVHSVASVNFFCCAAEDFEYPSAADMTVMIEALEHFDDPEKVMRKVLENTTHRVFVTVPIKPTVGINPSHKTDWTVNSLNTFILGLSNDWQIIHGAVQDNLYYMSCWQRLK